VRIWEFAVRRWQFTLVLFVLLVAMGVASLMSIPRAEDPKLNYPGAAIVVVYPGADPEDIEKLIVDPIEDAVSELDDVKKLTSDALDGIGIVDVEFFYGTDPDRKYDEVVREVNALRSGLPEGVVSVEIRRMKPSLVKIVQFALLSETAGWQQL
jgi:multidrug efflux pump subunit AcrB